MDEFREQVERFLDESCGGARNVAPSGYVWAPLADLMETPQAIIAQVELPGVPAELVVVEVLDGELVVRGERPCERGQEPVCQEEAGDPIYHIMERAHGTFARRFPLPPGIDAGAVSARLEGGLLTITVPKGRGRQATRFSLEVK
jgi:HSP20 family protein